VGKIAEKTVCGSVFLTTYGTQNIVPNCQKHTPTDFFIGDFAH